MDEITKYLVVLINKILVKYNCIWDNECIFTMCNVSSNGSTNKKVRRPMETSTLKALSSANCNVILTVNLYHL